MSGDHCCVTQEKSKIAIILPLAVVWEPVGETIPFIKIMRLDKTYGVRQNPWSYHYQAHFILGLIIQVQCNSRPQIYLRVRIHENCLKWGKCSFGYQVKALPLLRGRASQWLTMINGPRIRRVHSEFWKITNAYPLRADKSHTLPPPKRKKQNTKEKFVPWSLEPVNVIHTAKGI